MTVSDFFLIKRNQPYSSELVSIGKQGRTDIARTNRSSSTNDREALRACQRSSRGKLNKMFIILIISVTQISYSIVKFNFVGRILGPRGMTAKQLEQETGCKIMVRGKGSMRDKTKEDQMKGKPNWEHLNDELHVLITVEDTKNRAEVKIRRAIEEIKKLLVPAVSILKF
jgi:hypothetical protein